MQVMRIRLAMKEVRIQRLDYNEQDLVFVFDPETQVNPQILISWAQKDRRIRLLPGDRLAFHVGKVDPVSRIDKCISLLDRLGETINGGGLTPAGVPPPL
jgi:transcription-repair coupling factor (superfamily II helicase)